MNIFFIRHGESEHNKAMRDAAESKRSGAGSASAVDSRDLPLTADGQEQIRNALKKLPDQADLFYCSEHIRTRQSADIVQEKYPDLKCIFDARANASFSGSLDHKSFDEMQEITGIDFQKQVNDDSYDFRPWGGESSSDVHSRVQRFLKDILSQNVQTAVVVSSMEVIQSVYKILFSDKAPTIMRFIRVKNASVHEFKITQIDVEKPLQ